MVLPVNIYIFRLRAILIKMLLRAFAVSAPINLAFTTSSIFLLLLSRDRLLNLKKFG